MLASPLYTLPTSLQLYPTISLGCKKRRKKNRDHFPQLPKSNNNRSNLSYPKSSPTPVFISPSVNPRTPLTSDEALDRALISLQSTLARGIRVDDSIFSSILDACARSRSRHHVFLLRSLIPSRLINSSSNISSKLLHLYSSCGLLQNAHELFDRMPRRNKSVFAWNSLISGYVESGHYEDAMALYFQMEEEGMEPDRFTFPRALKACAGIGSVAVGQAVHQHAVHCGFGTDPFVLNALVDMYSKCGDIIRSRQVFDRIPQRDVVSWNSMIAGYIRHELLFEAVQCFRAMVRDGCEPDSVTVSTLLAVSSLLPTKVGLEIHGWVLRRGLQHHISVSNSLIRMYSASSQLSCATMIFESIVEKDLVSWNTIILAHQRNYEAVMIFHQMIDSGFVPDQVTFVSLLSACAKLGLVEDGKRFFEMMEKYGIKPSMEHYGCMVNLLGRAGSIDAAYGLVVKQMPFDGGPTVWGALLHACYVHGNVEIGEIAAEKLFELEPDNEHNFILLMRIYEKAGRTAGVEKVRRMMRVRGMHAHGMVVHRSL